MKIMITYRSKHHGRRHHLIGDSIQIVSKHTVGFRSHFPCQDLYPYIPYDPWKTVGRQRRRTRWHRRLNIWLKLMSSTNNFSKRSNEFEPLVTRAGIQVAFWIKRYSNSLILSIVMNRLVREVLPRQMALKAKRMAAIREIFVLVLGSLTQFTHESPAKLIPRARKPDIVAKMAKTRAATQ